MVVQFSSNNVLKMGTFSTDLENENFFDILKVTNKLYCNIQFHCNVSRTFVKIRVMPV